MRCSQAQRRVNDRIDHRLNREQIENLDRHLDACENCRGLFEDLASIVTAAGQLENVSPTADLWPSIKEKVTGRAGGAALKLARRNPFLDIFQFQKPFAFAASALLVVMMVTGLFYRDLPVFQNMGESTGKPTQRKTVAAHLREAEHHYQMAIAELSGAIPEIQENMDPELAEVFAKNMRIIDNSILVCRNAINRYPDNLDAKLYLFASYKRKIELLSEIKRITLQVG